MPLPRAPRDFPARFGPFLPAAAGMLFVFWAVLFAGEQFAARDHLAFHWPMKAILAHLFEHSAGIPLWNPLLGSGQPFAANPQNAVFHPLTALFLFLPLETAYRLHILSLVLVTAVSGYPLARALGLPRAAAAFSVVAWGLGGATMSALQLVPTLLTGAPLPALLAVSVRLGRRTARADVAAFGLLFGLMVLGGDPPVLLMTTLLSAIAVLHGHRLGGSGGEERGPLPVALGRLLLAGLLGAVLGAATLLPGLHHGMKTVRAEGLDPATALSFTTPVARLAELAIPAPLDFDRIVAGPARIGDSLYPERGVPFLASVYPGILLLAAALAGWIPHRNPARLWLIPAAFGVLLALGSSTPVFPALRTLPLFSGIRFPERFLILTLASLAVAGTIGFSRLLDRPSPGLRSAAAAGGLALLVATGLAAAGGSTAGLLGARLARQAGVLGLGLGTCALAARARRGSGTRLLPGFLLAADLAAAGRPLLASRPAMELRALPAPLVPLLRTPPHGYVFHAARQDTLRGNLGSMASPPFLAQFGIATALERDFDLTELAWSSRATASVLQAVASLPGQADAILARRGVAGIVAFRKDAPRSLAEARALPTSALLTLLAVPQPQPLAFSAERLVVAGGPEGWRAAVAAAGPGARALAVVDPADAPWPVPPAVFAARVAVSSRSASRVGLHVEAPGPGPSFVAVNQTWDPGWEARLNGKPLPVVRTDLSLTGLLVPPGRHEIVLAYRSVPVLAGAGISFVALAATALALRSRRPPSSRA